MQELIISEEQLSQFIGQYLWPLLRISAFYFAVPVIGARTVPARVRIILSLFTSIMIAPVLPPAPIVSFLSAQGFMMIIQEVLIGLALGFAPSDHHNSGGAAFACGGAALGGTLCRHRRIVDSFWML